MYCFHYVNVNLMLIYFTEAFQFFYLECYSYMLILIFVRSYRGLSQTYRGLNGGFLFLRIFSVAISVSPHVCFILDFILISMFLR